MNLEDFDSRVAALQQVLKTQNDVISSLQATPQSMNETDDVITHPEINGRTLERPPYTLCALSIMAIESFPCQVATVVEIQDQICCMFPFFRHVDDQSWRVMVQYTLSNDDSFFLARDVTEPITVQNIGYFYWKVNWDVVNTATFLRYKGKSYRKYKRYIHEELGVNKPSKLTTYDVIKPSALTSDAPVKPSRAMRLPNMPCYHSGEITLGHTDDGLSSYRDAEDRPSASSPSVTSGSQDDERPSASSPSMTSGSQDDERPSASSPSMTSGSHDDERPSASSPSVTSGSQDEDRPSTAVPSVTSYVEFTGRVSTIEVIVTYRPEVSPYKRTFDCIGGEWNQPDGKRPRLVPLTHEIMSNMKQDCDKLKTVLHAQRSKYENN